MDIIEVLILLFASYYSAKNLYMWYIRLSSGQIQGKAIKNVMGLLPLASFIIIVFTLKVLASFDVVNDTIYILFYIVMGFSWVFIGLNLVFYCFDISWIDDVFSNNNKAALWAIAGAFLGTTIIYSGANIGDGPGWWCVVFAGGLGQVTWIILGLIINRFTHIFERISVERDINCGIRIGFYFLASGIILARASAGDWTSFSMTIIEFLVGWPVILLAIIAIIIERYFINNASSKGISSSVFWGIIYVFMAIATIFLFPLPENPIYDVAIEAGWRFL